MVIEREREGEVLMVTLMWGSHLKKRFFDMIIEDLHSRDHVLMKPVLVINLEVKDNHEEVAIGARLALVLCQELETTEFWEDSIERDRGIRRKTRKRTSIRRGKLLVTPLMLDDSMLWVSSLCVMPIIVADMVFDEMSQRDFTSARW
ncbi:unnamed protein product [Camellia sinensis]